MNPNWIGIISLILALIAFLTTLKVVREINLKKRLSLTLLAVILAIPGASFTIYYYHIFPEFDWYYQFRSIAGTEVLIIFVGIAGGLAASLLHRSIRVLPLLCVLAFAIAPILKPFIGPFEEGELRDYWNGEICIQSTPSTCGAASIATILKTFGENVTEPELAAEAHSYRGGTEAWYLARAVRSRGYKAQFQFSSNFPSNIELPALVGVRFGSIGHFIPILERNGNDFIVGDPMKGKEVIPFERLMEKYDFTGFYMRVAKAE